MRLHISSTVVLIIRIKIVLYSIWYHHICRWPSGAQNIDPLMMST